MNVSLTEELERFVSEKVEEGTYASRSEVVRAGLRLLIERELRLEAERNPHADGPPDTDSQPIEEDAGGRGPASIPQELWPHFPDYRGSGLSLETHREVVIARLIEADDLRAAQWLRERVPSEELRRFLSRRGTAAGLDDEMLRLWGVLLDLDVE